MGDIPPPPWLSLKRNLGVGVSFGSFKIEYMNAVRIKLEWIIDGVMMEKEWSKNGV